jgi:hypothetical protein
MPTQWSPMVAAMLPMAFAMAQAQTAEHFGAGPEFQVAEFFSLGPEAKSMPPSSVPLWPRAVVDSPFAPNQLFESVGEAYRA